MKKQEIDRYLSGKLDDHYQKLVGYTLTNRHANIFDILWSTCDDYSRYFEYKPQYTFNIYEQL